MANPWFKFYAGDYLKEVKFKGVDANKRSCFLTLLCYAADGDGRVNTKYLTEDILRIEAGVEMGGEAWASTENFYQWLVDRDLGSIEGDYFAFKTWNKRQESYLTGAERAKRHRDKEKDEEDARAHVTNVTLEKNREDKNRREKKPHASLDWLISIPEDDLATLSEKYEASKAQIKRKAETMRNYCLSKGKTYRNYRAFLENGLDKDFGRRQAQAPPPKLEKRPLTQEELAALEKISAEVKEKAALMRVKD